MKTGARAGLTGLQNPGLELEMTANTKTIQVSGSPQGSRSRVKAAAWWASYSCSRRKQRERKLTGVAVETKYRGLAEDDEGDEEQRDETDTTNKNRQLNKKLLNHFRQLAATNRDTDQVDLEFLDEVISEGADPNSSDRYGQTILHEVSRAWSVDVMRFFLDRGSDLLQPDQFRVTVLHVASALDYQDMVQFLLDQKERSEAARVLLELGAQAGTKDSDGQLCTTALIGRMSPVAQLALSQFHVTDRMTRQQYYYLNLLEPEPHSPETHLQEAVISEPTSPLEVVVQHGKLDLIMNPVFLKLIQVKWKLYGRLGAWLLLILNFLFNVSWTTVAISVSVHRGSTDRYVLPQDWWRVLLVLLALLLTLQEVLREVQDILRSRRKLRLWRRWAERRLHDDLRRSHPMWPQERRFLLDQNKQIHGMRGSYSRDLWLMGPFIVMLGNIVGDVMCFLFLYAEIFVPYACSFWIIFGGSSSVPSMQSVSGLLYSLYRITLVDEYEYAAMVTVDCVMAPLLCGTFLAASSILCINLLIALLTDTFQRVHDNSQANAVMQQAAVILQVEESMPLLRHFYDNQYISNHCAPLADAHDDDITTNPHYHDEMGRITAQIKETLDQFLVLQRNMETVGGPRVQIDPNQDQELQDQQLHNQNQRLRNQKLCDQKPQDQNPQNQEHQNLQNQELRDQNLQNQEPQNLQNQELEAIRAELKQLRTLVQQLVQNRTESG